MSLALSSQTSKATLLDIVRTGVIPNDLRLSGFSGNPDLNRMHERAIEPQRFKDMARDFSCEGKLLLALDYSELAGAIACARYNGEVPVHELSDERIEAVIAAYPGFNNIFHPAAVNTMKIYVTALAMLTAGRYQ